MAELSGRRRDPSVCHSGVAASQSAVEDRPAQPGQQPSSAGVSRAGSSAASRSGRCAAVRRRDCSRRHPAIRAWLPDSSTSGTSRPAPARRAGVDRALQQPLDVRLLDHRLRVAKHPGQQPGDRLDDDQHRGFAPGQHVVADGDLQHLPAGARVGDHPGVDALIAPAGEDQPVRTGQPLGDAWVKGTPDGVGTTSRCGPACAPTSCRARPHGSASMTMPAPPPYGVSSTLWCRSVAQSRRSCRCRSSRPCSTALPISESRSGSK